jgi:hypothetical protein
MGERVQLKCESSGIEVFVVTIDPIVESATKREPSERRRVALDFIAIDLHEDRQTYCSHWTITVSDTESNHKVEG